MAAKTDLKKYLDDLSPVGRARFAEKCHTTVGTLYGIARGNDPCSPQVAVTIDRESGGAVYYRDVNAAYKKRHGKVTKPMDWGYVERKARAQGAAL